MNKIAIGKTLRRRRKMVGLSVKESCAFLAQHGILVSEKTVYGWENGYSQPDADILMILCTIYEIYDVLTTFGYGNPEENKALELSPQERKLVLKFREYEDMQHAVCALLKVE